MLSADHYIIEVGKVPAGILARVESNFQFFASATEALPLNRKTFPTVADAISAVAHAMARRDA